MRFIRNLQLTATALTALVLVPALQAASITAQTYTGTFPATISGTLPNQGTALEESITLPSSGDLTLLTTSYLTGGFEPNIVLFNSTGNFVAVSGTQGGAPLSPTDLDAYLSATGLTAGQYTIALTDWQLNQATTATNLSDGFGANYGDGTSFIDQNGVTRSGSYSLTADFTGSASTTTPEPASLLLVAPFLLIGAFLASKRIPFFGKSS